MNYFRPFISSQVVGLLLLFLCFGQTPIHANWTVPAKKVKYEKVLGYQLYPHVELQNNTFFVINDQVTWQHYFTKQRYDLRAPKVVDLDFSEDMVIVIFKKTHEIWKFETEKITNQNNNLYVAYEARIIGVNAFKTSNFLHVIKVKKGDFQNIRFFENHVPITDIPIDEEPKNALLPPVTFIPEFEEESTEGVDFEGDVTSNEGLEEKIASSNENMEALEVGANTSNEILEERIENSNRELEEKMEDSSNQMEDFREEMGDNSDEVAVAKKSMEDSNRELEEKKEALTQIEEEGDIEMMDNQSAEDSDSNEYLKAISDTEINKDEEEDDFFEDEPIIGLGSIEEESSSQEVRIEETPGINNQEPSVKDRLAQIMEQSEEGAEEQMEEIEDESVAYKTQRMAKVDETTAAAMIEVAESNQQFGFNVYEQLAELEAGNVVFSPFALSTSLAMTYAGARENTEKQMLQTLQFQQSSKNLHRNYERLLEELISDGTSLNLENTGTEMMIGNALWVDEKWEISDPFTDVARKHYRGNLQKIDFKDKAANEQISEWLKVKTAYNVLEPLPTDFKLNESNTLLTNTLHFKADWKQAFDRSYTQKTSFKLREDSSLQVNMMHLQGKLPYFENSMVKTIAIPCKDDFTLMLLIPKAYFQLKAVQKTLMRGGYTHWLNSMEEEVVQLSVPRFGFNTQTDLTEALEKVGMSSPFDKKSADFSGLFTKKNAPIGNVLHPVHFSINEVGVGTEGGRAKSVGADSEDATNEVETGAVVFEANRPFMFILMDNERKHLLLMGRVMQPELAE